MINHDLRVIQFLLDSGWLTENYVKTVTDICLLQARDAAIQEADGHFVSSEKFKEIVRKAVK